MNILLSKTIRYAQYYLAQIPFLKKHVIVQDDSEQILAGDKTVYLSNNLTKYSQNLQ